MDILAGFVERVPQSRRAQLLTVCAYLSWSAGHVGRAAEWGLKALLADEECTLAALVVTAVYGQINVYGVTTKSERHKRSYWTRTADGNGIGGRKAPVPYGS